MDVETRLYALEDREVGSVEGVDVPRWIDPDVTCSTVAAIIEGGCSSGAYMPAVTYHQARATMAEHGDDVLNFLEDYDDLDRFTLEGESWSGFACRVLSAAVEAWAHAVGTQIVELLEEEAADVLECDGCSEDRVCDLYAVVRAEGASTAWYCETCAEIAREGGPEGDITACYPADSDDPAADLYGLEAVDYRGEEGDPAA